MIVVKFFTFLAIFSFILSSINAQAPNLAGSKNSKIATTLYYGVEFCPSSGIHGIFGPIVSNKCPASNEKLFFVCCGPNQDQCCPMFQPDEIVKVGIFISIFVLLAGIILGICCVCCMGVLKK